MVTAAGGRVVVVQPGGPCLYCMNEIDRVEAAYFLSTPEQRAEQAQRGYVRGMEIPSPAVVSLNATLAGVAVNEFAVLVSGVRSVNVFTEYDLLGNGRRFMAQWLSPKLVKDSKDRTACVQCALAGRGDQVEIERYQSDKSAADRVIHAA